MCLFIYKCLIYQIHCEVSFHSLVMKCWFLKGFNSVYIKISVHSMKEKQNFLLQMVVSNCLKLLKFALFQITTLISYCRDLQTVIYQFFFICDYQLWSSEEIFSGLPWFHHRRDTFLFSGMFEQAKELEQEYPAVYLDFKYKKKKKKAIQLHTLE